MTEALGLFTDDLQKQLTASEKQIETLSAEKSDLEKQLAKAKAESAPLVEFSNSDDDDDRDELADGDDAQAESLWKAHADLRDEFTGKFSAFKAAFTKSPEDFADFN
jgi:F0F1-type ATP synthase membrane subunit b/b'